MKNFKTKTMSVLLSLCLVTSTAFGVNETTLLQASAYLGSALQIATEKMKYVISDAPTPSEFIQKITALSLQVKNLEARIALADNTVGELRAADSVTRKAIEALKQSVQGYKNTIAGMFAAEGEVAAGYETIIADLQDQITKLTLDTTPRELPNNYEATKALSTNAVKHFAYSMRNAGGALYRMGKSTVNTLSGPLTTAGKECWRDPAGNAAVIAVGTVGVAVTSYATYKALRYVYGRLFR